MKASEPGESAIQLPWLAPGSEALAALARFPTADCWQQIKHDPGAVLYLLRQLPEHAECIDPDSFAQPDLLDDAIQFLSCRAGFVDWNRAAPAQLLRTALRVASLAEAVARHSGRTDPALAWCAGLLTPLGWFGLAAADPELAGQQHLHLYHPADSAALEHPRWQPLHLTRRLARHWHLPAVIRAVLSYLGMPIDQMVAMGAPATLATIVQWAVTQAGTEGHRLGITASAPFGELTQRLNLDEHQVLAMCERLPKLDPGTFRWLNPYEQHHLPDLLHLAAAQRRLERAPYGPPVEDEIDRLQALLADQEASETARLQQMKLKSLAEFAGGAGHEINNPLAVISGQGQYLLNRETDPARQAPLRTIIRQAERIHSILTDLMQFAKPPTPAVKTIDLTSLALKIIDDYRWQAEPKKLQLDVVGAESPVLVDADPAMIRTAVACLICNAIDATPTNGWIRVTLRPGQDTQIIIEDSGAGPKVAHHEHLFDPFFSGRSAGRGRGLGLPTAWRFTAENGGTLRFEPHADSPSRFVISLPGSHALPHTILRNPETQLDRKSA